MPLLAALLLVTQLFLVVSSFRAGSRLFKAPAVFLWKVQRKHRISKLKDALTDLDSVSRDANNLL